jgi:hypothetical protein
MRDIFVSFFAAAIYLVVSTLFRAIVFLTSIPGSTGTGKRGWFTFYFLLFALPSFLGTVPAATAYRRWSPHYHPQVATVTVAAICVLTTFIYGAPRGDSGAMDGEVVFMIGFFLLGIYLSALTGVRIADRNRADPQGAA